MTRGKYGQHSWLHAQTCKMLAGRSETIALHQHPSQKSKPSTFQTTQISTFLVPFISGSWFNRIYQKYTTPIRPPGTKPLSHSIATSTSAYGITTSL